MRNGEVPLTLILVLVFYIGGEAVTANYQGQYLS
jgi:hypothetical protein